MSARTDAAGAWAIAQARAALLLHARTIHPTRAHSCAACRDIDREVRLAQAHHTRTAATTQGGTA